jgi:hypothetical protein
MLLSRNPYPCHYSSAFAFSTFLYLHPHQRLLRFAFRLGEGYRLSVFRLDT